MLQYFFSSDTLGVQHIVLAYVVIGLLVAAAAVYIVLSPDEKPPHGFPILYRELSPQQQKQMWLTNASEMIQHGYETIRLNLRRPLILAS